MGAPLSIYTPKKGEGAYRNCAKTGLTTGVAAGTGTAGHLWTFRWAPVTAGGAAANDKRRVAVLQRFRARWFTISGFTGAQEVGLDLFKVTAYTAAHTGGNAITPSKKVTGGGPVATPGFPASIMTGRVATTGELTAGTHTFETDPLASGAFAELATAATVAKGAFELFMSTEDLERYPVVLFPNEGLVLRNTILQGAGGTARIVVETDWLEVERY